jgi:hypothetical protein
LLLSKVKHNSLYSARLDMRRAKKRTEAAVQALKRKRESCEVEKELQSGLWIFESPENDLPTCEPETKKFKPGRPGLPYNKQLYKRKIRQEVWDFILSISGSTFDAERLILDVLKRYLPDLHARLVAFNVLSQNLTEVFEIFKNDIRGSSFGAGLAATATKGLSLEKCSDITGYSTRTISRGKIESLTKQIATCENREEIVDVVPTNVNKVQNQIPSATLYPNPTPYVLDPVFQGSIVHLFQI